MWNKYNLFQGKYDLFRAHYYNQKLQSIYIFQVSYVMGYCRRTFEGSDSFSGFSWVSSESSEVEETIVSLVIIWKSQQ